MESISHSLVGVAQQLDAIGHQHSNGKAQTPHKASAVWDFLTATRHPGAFRSVRDKFPDFDLINLPGADGAACLIWATRLRFETSSVQNGRTLDDCVHAALDGLSHPDARAACTWLTDPKVEEYTFEREAEEAARRMVQQWQKRAQLASTFELLSYTQLRAMPRLSWVIDQVLPTGGTSWLTATSGHGKSFWALEAACCVATGTPFFGRPVKQGNVVYVAAEGISGIPDRLEAWAKKHGCDVPEVPSLCIIRQPVDIASPEVRAAFVASIEAVEPVFVVLDTQGRCAVGRDMDKTIEATVFYDAISKVADELSAQVLTLAHNNKSGAYAGNHQGPAMVDTHLTIARDGERVRLRCSKQKDGAPEEAAHMDYMTRVVELDALDEQDRVCTSLVLEQVEMSDEPEKKPSAKTIENRETIGAALALFDEIKDEYPDGVKLGTWQELCKERGVCSGGGFYRIRMHLVESGELERCGHHHRSTIYRRGAKNSTTPTTPTTPTGSNGSDVPSSELPTPTTPTHLKGVGVVGVVVKEPKKPRAATSKKSVLLEREAPVACAGCGVPDAAHCMCGQPPRLGTAKPRTAKEKKARATAQSEPYGVA